MKVYIAGKITGDPNYKGKFAAEAEKIRAAGHIAMNPAELPEGMEQVFGSLEQDFNFAAESCAVSVTGVCGDCRKRQAC